jgi:hypothetical protein
LHNSVEIYKKKLVKTDCEDCTDQPISSGLKLYEAFESYDTFKKLLMLFKNN